MPVVRCFVSTLGRLLLLTYACFDRVRDKLRGAYTPERLRELAAYAQRPQCQLRSVLVMLVTPLPCFLTLVAVDALALAPIENGIANQTVFFWLRNILGSGLMAGAAFLTIVESVPALRLSCTVLRLTGPVIGVATLPTMYLLIRIIGFPVPFALIANSPSWSVIMIAGTLLCWKDTLRTNKKARDDLLHVTITFSALITIVFVYTALSYLFSTLSTSSQNIVSSLLPFVKLVFTTWVNFGLHHSPLIKPIYSVFTLDLFHVLFISTAMQQNVAGSALLIALGIDVLLSLIAMYGVHRLARRVHNAMEESHRIRCQTETKSSQRCRTLLAVNRGPIAYALHVLDTSKRVRSCVGSQESTRPTQPCDGPTLQQAFTPKIVPAVSHPTTIKTANPSDGVDHERTVAELILKLLYKTEFYVLTEYAEAIVAFIYGAYLYTLSILPNRIFYPQVAMLTPDELRDKAHRVLAYASLEMFLFAVFSVVLGYLVGRFSPIAQLGFVLEKHWRFIQTLLVTWITFVVLSTVEHLGADYTFQFKWLEHPNGTTDS